ncbi:hypothetical protein LSTR_LSTR014338 [Laodelphax striatellus]|uniref:Uncharacterized protein n=1 Tax=Laodelphax striatellus TaxID=195883 RepID=A0A482XDB1_LAOST|nr:hypothetical protein LSTR_LSTR014338 [Laodelphax striatellus]
MSRTPGDIAPRARKCSIVTEECDDEDEEEEECGGGVGGVGDHSHSSAHSLSLNRRGSRSEGKLHLAVQELRREAALAVPPINVISEASTAPEPLSPASSVHKMASAAAAAASVKSASGGARTLPAPLATALSSPQLGVAMPPPKDASATIKEIGLKDIAEDSTKVTSPRAGFVGYEQRRGKFRKTRTASCSSSDASDEDYGGPKKRTKKSQLHRSRDFQDPGGSGGGGEGGGGGGNSGGGNNNGGGSLGGSGSENIPPDAAGGEREAGQENGGGGGRRQCFNGGGGGGGGRHRRGRGGETRLRESQSLNRITEVQEAPEPQAPPTQAQAPPKAPPPSPTPGAGEVLATNRNAAATGGKRSSALIGRYLNLQRKLCGMPLWGGGKQQAQRLCKGGSVGGGGGGTTGGGGSGMCHLHIGTTTDKCCHLC